MRFMDLGWRGIWPVGLLGAYSEDKGKELLRRQAWRTEVHVNNIILDVAVVGKSVALLYQISREASVWKQVDCPELCAISVSPVGSSCSQTS